MSRFAQVVRPPKPDTVNEEGFAAYSKTPRLDMASLVLTSFADDKFYESGDDRIQRLRELVYSYPGDFQFFAKTAIMARQWGMRTMPTVLMAELARYAYGEKWLKGAIAQFVLRPDDATEMVAYHLKTYGPVPNAMKRGIAMALHTFGDYSLAKYKGKGKDVNLYDVVTLTHAHSAPIARLMEGTLEPADTWETAITACGDDKLANTAEWERLVREEKLGYFALLRNLRNIEQHCSEAVIHTAAEQLMDPVAVSKSKVLPFRFMTAYREVISLPKFEGKTCVALDLSGSMSGRPIEIGSMLAMAIAKQSKADLVVFGSNAMYAQYNPAAPVLELARGISANMGGTNFGAVFQTLDKRYDRIFLLSDQEAWQQIKTSEQYRKDYYQKYGRCPLWVFDLQGYGTMQFPENSVYFVSGWSERVFDVIAAIGNGGVDGLVSYIEKQVAL